MSSPKERGILFSGAMVRALLAGKKTQTRRAVKRFPREMNYMDAVAIQRCVYSGGFSWHDANGNCHSCDGSVRCPYDVPRLWVRETHVPNYFHGGRPGYRADWTPSSADYVPEPRWTPSLLMKRTDSRITLAVTGIRVERAQAISDADIEAEGVDAEAVSDLWHAASAKSRRDTPLYDGTGPTLSERSPHDLWRMCWCLINGRASWDANPCVWVVSFKLEGLVTP